MLSNMDYVIRWAQETTTTVHHIVSDIHTASQ